MASYTVRNVGGVCKAFQIENGVETLVCTEGQKVGVGASSYTVKKDSGVCCIFEVTSEVMGGDVEEVFTKVCSEGQTL